MMSECWVYLQEVAVAPFRILHFVCLWRDGLEATCGVMSEEGISWLEANAVQELCSPEGGSVAIGDRGI